MRTFLHAWAAALVVAACSSSNGEAPAECAGVGGACTHDAECCTGHCVIEGNGAYCQKSAGACIVSGQRCTEDAQCCGGEPCIQGACAGVPPPPANPTPVPGYGGPGGPGGGPSCGGLLARGQVCRTNADCCSGTCRPASGGRYVCD